jgi:hypothetical protein
MIIHQLGIVLGDRPGAGLAWSSVYPVSKDTLLRVVRRCALLREAEAVRVPGIDDFRLEAWPPLRHGPVQSGTTTGHRLLPDLEAGRSEAWPADHSRSS